jgi:pilus assembly protein CpaE
VSIVLATASIELEHRVKSATDGASLHLPLGPLPFSPEVFLEELGAAARPEVVMLDSGKDPQPALQLAADFYARFPGVSVILVTDAAPEVTLAAMRAGVRDIVHPAAETADLRLTLARAAAAAQALRRETETSDAVPTQHGRVITVASPKGGVGKTTVATNLAVALAQQQPSSTVLVDLDLQFGDVASALDLEPEYCLPDAVRGPAARDTMVLKTFLTLHSTSLYVICGARSPADADSVTAEDVTRLLQMLVTEFAYVVVDTSPGLSEHVLAVLDETTDLVLVTSMDVPGVRGLRKELDALTALGMPTEARHIVVNFSDARGGLSVTDVEATLGTTVGTLVPRSKVVLESVNQGVPLLQAKGRDPMSKELQRLAARYASPEAPVQAKQAERQRTQKPPSLPPEAQPKRAASRWYRLRRKGS